MAENILIEEKIMYCWRCGFGKPIIMKDDKRPFFNVCCPKCLQSSAVEISISDSFNIISRYILCKIRAHFSGISDELFKNLCAVLIKFNSSGNYIAVKPIKYCYGCMNVLSECKCEKNYVLDTCIGSLLSYISILIHKWLYDSTYTNMLKRRLQLLMNILESEQIC